MASRAGLYLAVTGTEQAGAAMDTLEAGARSLAAMRLVAGSPLRYAHAIEVGSHRKKGPAWMLRGGLAASQGQIPALIQAMISHGSAAGKDTTDAIRRTLLGNIQWRTPVKTGRLRDSFTVRGAR